MIYYLDHKRIKRSKHNDGLYNNNDLYLFYEIILIFYLLKYFDSG